MRNSIECDNCRNENPIYQFNCHNCQTILRNRIVNIDLWKGIAGLLESPVKTFTSFIQAEHKNFVIFLTLLAGLKYFLISLQLKNAFKIGNPSMMNNLVINFIITVIFVVLFLLLTALLMKLINKLFAANTRLKDNYTIYLYSLSPVLLLFPLLVIIEFAVFGRFWFNFNPPAHVIKPTVAYMLYGVEGLLILFGGFLTVMATYTQTRLKVYSIITGLFITISLYFLLMYLPFVPIS